MKITKERKSSVPEPPARIMDKRSEMLDGLDEVALQELDGPRFVRLIHSSVNAFTENPCKARVYNAKYLITTHWSWEHFVVPVKIKELERRKKEYQSMHTEDDEDTPTSYECLKCGFDNQFNEVVFQNWTSELHHACEKCKKKHSIIRGKATLLKK